MQDQRIKTWKLGQDLEVNDEAAKLTDYEKTLLELASLGLTGGVRTTFMHLITVFINSIEAFNKETLMGFSKYAFPTNGPNQLGIRVDMGSDSNGDDVEVKSKYGSLFVYIGKDSLRVSFSPKDKSNTYEVSWPTENPELDLMRIKSQILRVISIK